MEWLSKAGDLLDKLDKQAAEKLENVGFETVTPPNEDDLLNIEKENQDDVGDIAAVAEETAGEENSAAPDGALKRELQRLEGLVRKKTDQIEQLVSSHRAQIKQNADRDKKTAAEVEKAQAEVTKANAGRRAAEKGKQEAEQQAEAMRAALKGQAGELEALREEAGNHRSEQEVLNEEILRLEGEVKRQEELHASLQQRYEAAVAKVTETDAEHRTHLLDFQEAEATARELQVKLRGATEAAEEAAAREAAWQRKAEAFERENKQALEQLAEGERSESERMGQLEAEARESKKKMQEAQLQLRQLERIHSAASATPYQRPAEKDADLQAQLSKMCEEVLAKQAVLEGLMGEKVALRSRLEAEVQRNQELSGQLSRWQAAVRHADPEAGLGEPPKMSVGEAFTSLVASRDIAQAAWALDDLLRVTAGHISADATVRAIAGVYLLVLQLSAFIVLLHALLGSHH